MDELTAKRLAVIRYLFEKGKTMSYEAEPLNGLSLLPFHDSIEMFMKLCADVKGISIPRNTMFAEYFNKIPELKDKAQMESLNARRVSLKHHGQLPSSLDVEITRVNVIDFFNHNMPVFFECQIEDVSLEVMIVYPSTREYLRKYHGFLREGKYGSAQAQCKIALRDFLNCYHEQHNRYLKLKDGPGRNANNLSLPNFEPKTDKCIEALKDDVLKINEAITVMNLGINYYLYEEFMNKGACVEYWPDEEADKFSYYVGDESQYNKDTAEKYYKFVIENCLRIQGSQLFF